MTDPQVEPATKRALPLVIAPPRGRQKPPRHLADLTAQLATSGAGGALVGPSTTSVDGGVLDQVRSIDGSGSFATVDVTDLAAGRLVSVLALVRSASGENGAWGTTRSADGQLPQ